MLLLHALCDGLCRIAPRCVARVRFALSCVASHCGCWWRVHVMALR